MVNTYFNNSGIVSGPNKDGIVRFSLVGFSNIVKYVLPHFEKYPLQSTKVVNYNLWNKCVSIMKAGDHLTLPGLMDILAHKKIMNFGLSKKLERAFPNLIEL